MSFIIPPLDPSRVPQDFVAKLQNTPSAVLYRYLRAAEFKIGKYDLAAFKMEWIARSVAVEHIAINRPNADFVAMRQIRDQGMKAGFAAR